MPQPDGLNVDYTSAAGERFNAMVAMEMNKSSRDLVDPSVLIKFSVIALKHASTRKKVVKHSWKRTVALVVVV